MTLESNHPVATPAIEIHEAVVARNIQRMADYARRHGLGLRPHAKTHKSLRLARMQLQAGAVGLAVAKVGEAEVMAQVCDDLLIAYPSVDQDRCVRIAELARRVTVRVAVDSALAADMLASAAGRAGAVVGVLVDVDVGLGRTGVQTPRQALDLACHIADTRGLRLDGVMIYPGHVRGPSAAQGPHLWRVGQRLGEVLGLWQSRGLEAKIVSGGSTPTAVLSNLVPQLTEIRPGTYIFNDYNTILSGQCTLDDCAARVVCTVISNAVPGKVVLDAGSKALGGERAMIDPDTSGYGLLVDFPQARIVRLSEEHGEVDVSACPQPPALGQRVCVVPNHICACINLHDAARLVLPDGTAEILTIDARGKLS